MPKYLLLKHYRGGPEPHLPFPDGPVGAEDVEAHLAFLRHVSELLEENGEYVGAPGALRRAHWVRYGGPDAAPVHLKTDGPLPENERSRRRLFMIDVVSHERRGRRSRPTSLASRPGRGAAVRAGSTSGGHVRGTRSTSDPA